MKGTTSSSGTDPSEIATAFGVSLAELSERRAIADAKLIERRRTRVPPSVDDKAVVAWNGLALRAFAEAAVAFDRADYSDVAVGIAEFTAAHATTSDGRVVRSWRDGKVSGPGFCDDYAAMAVGLFALYQATSDERWYSAALRLTDEMIRLFADPAGGAFFAVGADSADLIARPKNLMDNPAPSDNSLAAEALSTRAAYTGEADLEVHISGITQASGVLAADHPMAVGHLLSLLAVSPLRQVAIVPGTDTSADDLVDVFHSAFRPGHVLAVGSAKPGGIPLLDQRISIDGKAAAYVCEGFVCRLPTTEPAEFAKQLAGGTDSDAG